MSSSLFQIRDAIISLGRNHDPMVDWSGTGNFRFAFPKLVATETDTMMFATSVDTKSTGHFSADARIIVRSTIGKFFTEDGFYRACNMNLDWHGAIPLATFQPDSCFVQLKYHHFDEIVACADLYCGGFGGWQHAADFLASHFDLPFQFLWAIDRDATAAKCHSQNFGGTLISEEVVEHYPLPTNEKLVICGSCDFVFLNRVNFQIPVKGATASFPCPPWSRGSKGKGFEYHDGGLAILEILRAGIVNNWEFILLENVDAIVENFHFSWIRTYIDEAGYCIAYSNISCIGEISAAKRKRWICIIVQKHLKCNIPQNAFEWNMTKSPTLRNCKIIPSCLPAEHEKDLTLSKELVDIYGNPAFAPPGMKSRFTIEKRIKHGYEQMSTATATYGKQHELPVDIICTEQSYGKGIYADLVQGNFGPRFWSPVEIAMTMIFFKKTFFPLLPCESHRLVGNAISTMHAIKAIFVLFAGCFRRRLKCFEDVFHVALMKRLHMENSNIYILNDWIVVEPISFNISDIQISMTLPMPKSVAISWGNQRTTVEIPQHCTIDDLLSILGISHEEVYVSWKPAHIRARQGSQMIPNSVEEICIADRYRVQTNITAADDNFVHECIRNFKASEAFATLSPEPVFFTVRIFRDETLCMNMNIWTGVRVQAIAEVCWFSGIGIGWDLSCIRVVPEVTNDQTNVGRWGLSGKMPCEIHVITKKHEETRGFSTMFWDETRRSPMMGQRIGEASHPGPAFSITVDFRIGDSNVCVARQDIGTRISKHDIAARLGVKIHETFLFDPIKQSVFSWDEISANVGSRCFVKLKNEKVIHEKNDRQLTFWDFLPTALPRIMNCKIVRNHDFLFGTIHRLNEIEIFNEQFDLILHEMNEKLKKIYNHDFPQPEKSSARYHAEGLVATSPCQTYESNENEDAYHQQSQKPKEPDYAAGENKRRCKHQYATKQSEFWVHLPLGKYCVVIQDEECENLCDVVQKAFLRAKVANFDHIMSGCYCTVSSKVCELNTKIESIPGTIIRVHLRGLVGGGKEEIVRMTNAKLGELLIHKGLPINAVAAKVQKIIEKLGLSQVHQAMQNQSEIHAWRQIEHLAQQIDFAIFNEKEKKSLSATLIQRAVKKKNKGNMSGASIAIDQFTIPIGNFVNEDLTETPIISFANLKAGSHGVVLTTEEKITPWIQNGVKSSADELGAVFLGNPTTNIHESYQPTSICFAALNHDGKECVLRGTLLQLGGKKIALNQHFKVEGANAMMTTCSLTAYASDFRPEIFAKLLTSPAKFMLSQLPNDTIRNAISSVWGRSFMKDGKRVPNLEAESVQVHISIKSDKIPELLKCSGVCNIYITPKTESGLFDPKYHLIWTDFSKIAIEQKMNEITNHLGYIKGRKGFALRFLATDAADGFKTLFPGQSFEQPVAVNALYRLQPVPFGILPDVLTEACKAIKWNIKPIKRSGNSWLVGADKQSPDRFLIIDGTTIFIKEVEKGNVGKEPICLAGPRPKKTQNDRGADPFIADDPWASFKPSSLGQSPAVTSFNQASVQSSSQGASRQLNGPVEERFKSQEARIQKLEQKLDDSMQQMKDHQADTKQELEKQQREIVDMKDAFKSELIGLQKGITMSFQDSLKQAMQQQTQDMTKLFMESPTGSSPFKKQPKVSN